MEMARLNHPQSNERILMRRAGRGRRSRWLASVLFWLFGLGLVLLLRMNPAIVADAASYASAQDHPRHGIITKPSDVRVRIMPANAVPIRRGGTLQTTAAQGPGPDTQTPDTQSQADALGAQLASMRSGG